jgi:hypothetical protein
MAIGDLVANLSVNSQPWTKGLNKASSGARSWVGSISSIVAPVAGLMAGVWGAKTSVAAYSESITQARKLESVLTATGGAAGLTGQQIADYAAELQSVTNFEDDATVGAAAMLAAFTNVRGDVFKDALASAQDMSVVLGTDLQTNVALLGKALNDPVDGLAKLARAGVQFSEAQKQQIEQMQHSGDLLGAQGVILDAVAGKFGGAAQATADPMKQLANTVGDVAEGIGSLMLPALSVGASALSDLMGTAVNAGTTMRDFGIEAAVQLSHFGSYLVLTATQAELFGVQLVNGIGHFFTDEMPAYLDWFGNNWQNLFVDIASNTLTIFENMGTNIRDAMGKIWDYIASGGKTKLELSWQSLTEGFVKTVADLPDIPERVASDYEKSLMSSIDAQTENLVTSMQEQRDKLTEQFSPLNASPTAGTAGDLTDLSKPDKEKTLHEKRSENKAILAGSSEAASIMLRGINGTSNDPKLTEQKKTNQKLDQLVTVTKSNKPAEPKIIE